MRHVIAHGHIFKNAGTTFDSALKNAFEGSFVDHRDDHSMRTGGAAYLERYLHDNPGVKAISSHHLCSPLPQNSSISYLSVYFLRDPIERVVSVYNFERQQPVSTPGSKKAKELDLIDYVKWRLRDDVPPTIRNYQTLYIGDERLWKPGIDANSESLSSAIDVLTRQDTFFGLVDDFSRSFDHIITGLQGYFPGTKFKYKASNVASNLDPEEKRRSAYRLLEPVMPQLVQANIYDISLYQYARAMFPG